MEEHLLDSSATLTLLIKDLSSNARPTSGLPVETRGRVIALKRDISVVMDYISQIIHKEQAELQQQEEAYRSQNAEGSHNFGRAYLDITMDQLEHSCSIHFTWKQIAKKLNVSYSTVQDEEENTEWNRAGLAALQMINLILSTPI